MNWDTELYLKVLLNKKAGQIKSDPSKLNQQIELALRFLSPSADEKIKYIGSQLSIRKSLQVLRVFLLLFFIFCPALQFLRSEKFKFFFFLRTFAYHYPHTFSLHRGKISTAYRKPYSKIYVLAFCSSVKLNIHITGQKS